MTMTLQEILPAVKQLPLAEKIELRRLLAEEAAAVPEPTSEAEEAPAIPTWESLYFGEGKSDIGPDGFPVTDGQTYYVYTPMEWSGVEILAEELRKLEAKEAQ